MGTFKILSAKTELIRFLTNIHHKYPGDLPDITLTEIATWSFQGCWPNEKAKARRVLEMMSLFQNEDCILDVNSPMFLLYISRARESRFPLDNSRREANLQGMISERREGKKITSL